jgi:hypothetical protein
MGHHVTALVGSEQVLLSLARQEGIHNPVPASASHWLLPLTSETIDKLVGIPVGETVTGFCSLYPKLVEKLRGASTQSWIVYVETEYFGGRGYQGAVAVQNGMVVYGPQAAEAGCINKALAAVGIKVAPPSNDEFETVGLHQERFTEDWLPEGEDSDA